MPGVGMSQVRGVGEGGNWAEGGRAVLIYGLYSKGSDQDRMSLKKTEIGWVEQAGGLEKGGGGRVGAGSSPAGFYLGPQYSTKGRELYSSSWE